MLKHLMIEEMVALVSPWIENAQRKRLFLSIPEIAGLHPKVVAAHESVLAVRPSKAGSSAAMSALNDELARVDDRHDHLARAVCWGVDAHRAHCLGADPPDRERAATCDQVQPKLFPSGLNIIKASPTAEAGNTARVARLLDEEPSIGEFLKGIPAPGKTTLLHTTQRWIKTGKELEAIEHRRDELAAKEKTAPVTKATVAAARSQWFRVVSAVLSNLELSDAPAEAVETIRGPVLKASERAGKRYAGAPAGEGPSAEEPGEPAVGEEEAGAGDGEIVS
ncbi:hypothetical protein [Sorangium cellulosum]|uniref:Uncharacterized protein n=1 Tax=Sorangium cellulosum TaxID=56 RepID=A0A150QXN2_SORCE|nr:hypothetical protein [Sorangium cellulosum]KYF72744.1 hypothetical protein BE15_41900 [Sorangium cellulosum]